MTCLELVLDVLLEIRPCTPAGCKHLLAFVLASMHLMDNCKVLDSVKPFMNHQIDIPTMIYRISNGTRVLFAKRD